MVAVITGASARVGRAAVRAFARQGADVGLVARGSDGLEAARREVQAFGGRALVLPTDVAARGPSASWSHATRTRGCGHRRVQDRGSRYENQNWCLSCIAAVQISICSCVIGP
jgi:NAD(P)-dependent dehydrogenase (short-subunit alcohol dehydrogenase family)